MAQSWYNYTAPDAGKPARVDIFDEIGGYGIGAKDFAETLKQCGESEIEIHIHSPGGSITDGLAIYNMLAASKGAKTVHIDGLAASMASVIAMAGNKIVMPANALMMIHNPWSCTMGDAEQLRKDAAVLDKMKGSIVGIYAAATGKKPEEISALMDAETWMNGEEAVAAGFADELAPALMAAAKLDVSKVSNKIDPRAVALMEAKSKHEAQPTPVEANPVAGSLEPRSDDLEAVRASAFAAGRADGYQAGRDARSTEIAVELETAGKAALAAIAERDQFLEQVKAKDAEVARLASELAQATAKIAEATSKYEESQRKHAALLGGVNFSPELSWPEALAKCGNNYAEARKNHRAAYDAFMAAALNRGK